MKIYNKILQLFSVIKIQNLLLLLNQSFLIFGLH